GLGSPARGSVSAGAGGGGSRWLCSVACAGREGPRAGGADHRPPDTRRCQRAADRSATAGAAPHHGHRVLRPERRRVRALTRVARLDDGLLTLRPDAGDRAADRAYRPTRQEAPADPRDLAEGGAEKP